MNDRKDVSLKFSTTRNTILDTEKFSGVLSLVSLINIPVWGYYLHAITVGSLQNRVLQKTNPIEQKTNNVFSSCHTDKQLTKTYPIIYVTESKCQKDVRKAVRQTERPRIVVTVFFLQQRLTHCL